MRVAAIFSLFTFHFSLFLYFCTGSRDTCVKFQAGCHHKKEKGFPMTGSLFCLERPIAHAARGRNGRQEGRECSY